MKDMKVFTYYQMLPQLPAADESKLIALWKESWERQGFQARVLTGYHAMGHPDYHRFFEAASKLPSVNPSGYDLACYLRWLAVAAVLNETEIGVMSDYDVMNYGWQPIAVLGGPTLNCFEKHVPSVVAGSKEAFGLQAMRIMHYQPTPEDCYEGKPHVSDMHILKHAIESDRRVPAAFAIHHTARHYSEEGWQTALLVHYPNWVMTKAQKQPKWKHIPELRKP